METRYRIKLASGMRVILLAGALITMQAIGLVGSCHADNEHATGHTQRIQSAVNIAYKQFKTLDEGSIPEYIPALQNASPSGFAIAVVTADGKVYSAGDTGDKFAIMSAAKPFTLAMVMQQQGAQVIVDRVGVEPTGMPYNSIEAIAINPERSVNPLVNAGALATVSLIEGDNDEQKWNSLLQWYRGMSDAELELLPDVYQSVKKTGYRNRAVSNLLFSYKRLYAEPESVRDIYNRQSSVGVNTIELAMMGATLANNGKQPRSGVALIEPHLVSQVLSIMTMAGMYDGSGIWAWQVGLPAKSGVGGGIVAVVPGKMAIAAWSPLLDENGNSVKAAQAIRYIAEELELGIFGSVKHNTP